MTGKKLLGAKSPVFSFNSFHKIGHKARVVDQPYLADLEAFQFATTRQSPKVLQTVSIDLGNNLDGYVVSYHNRGNWGIKETIPTSLSDAGQLLYLASLVAAKHF